MGVSEDLVAHVKRIADALEGGSAPIPPIEPPEEPVEPPVEPEPPPPDVELPPPEEPIIDPEPTPPVFVEGEPQAVTDVHFVPEEATSGTLTVDFTGGHNGADPDVAANWDCRLFVAADLPEGKTPQETIWGQPLAAVQIAGSIIGATYRFRFKHPVANNAFAPDTEFVCQLLSTRPKEDGSGNVFGGWSNVAFGKTLPLDLG